MAAFPEWLRGPGHPAPVPGYPVADIRPPGPGVSAQPGVPLAVVEQERRAVADALERLERDRHRLR